MSAFQKIGGGLKKAGRWFVPETQVSEDGRQQWSSRTSYLLASMGGAISFGNLLRFPSVVFNNNGLQWFIPYLIALGLLAIPVLVLEIAIGQAYRGGSTVAYNTLNKRTRGVGLGMVMVGYVVCIYYVPILAYLMKYFRQSFQSPLPWTGRAPEFYTENIIANPAPIVGNFTSSGGVESYSSYSDVGIIGETLGWTAFSWFVIWLCIFKGVGVTGKIVYFSMGLPIIVTIILVGRGVSLPNAGRGVRLYFAEFHGEKLASGAIWQAATGQVFYSTGVGFGYFSAYASYNSQFANAVQDAIVICCCNATFETIAAFAVFGVVGFLGIQPGGPPLGSFELGFQTLPAGLAEMPAAQFWSVLFFFTLFLLGVSSAFVMLDALITTICDTEWGSKFSRPTVVTTVTVVSFLLSMMYTTRFGDYLMNAVDTWTNNVALLFIVWAECVAATTMYRWRDVVGQVGLTAFLIHNGGYFCGMLFGLVLAHAVSPAAGAGLGFGLYIGGVVISCLFAKHPDSEPPGFWKRSMLLTRFWWMGCYSGNQLRRDLNVIVANGKNWKLPVYWAPILRYITAPILAIIWSFAYPSFYQQRNDPLDIFAFTVAHLILALVVGALFMPRFLDVFIPRDRREEGKRTYAPQVLMSLEDVKIVKGIEAAERSGSDARSESLSDGVVQEAKDVDDVKDDVVR